MARVNEVLLSHISPRLPLTVQSKYIYFLALFFSALESYGLHVNATFWYVNCQVTSFATFTNKLLRLYSCWFHLPDPSLSATNSHLIQIVLKLFKGYSPCPFILQNLKNNFMLTSL